MSSDGDDATQRAPLRLPGPLARLSAPMLVQFVKFGIVGVSNTLLAFAIYGVWLRVLGGWFRGAWALGFVVGAVNGFLLNRRWTFAGHVGDSLTPVRWGIVQGCGLALNEGLLFVFVDGADVEKLLGQAFATGIVTVITFLVNRAWTFRMHPPIAAAETDP